MATISLVFRKNKLNSKDKAPINIRIIKNQKSSYISTGYSIHQNDWDFKRNKVKSSYPNSARLNHILSKSLHDYSDKFLDVQSDNHFMSAVTLKNKIKSKGPTNFFTYGSDFIVKYETKGEIGTHRRAKTIIKKLKDYIKREELLIEEIDLKFLHDYENYLRTEFKNTNSTIHANFKMIRTIINNFIKEGNMNLDKNPFLNYKLKPDISERIYLTSKELQEIADLNIRADSRLFHHRNMYLFSAYAHGLRISDVLQLKWCNYREGRLFLIIQKTKVPLSIKLPDRAIEILNNYKVEGVKDNDRIFPALKCKDITTPVELHRAISAASAYINKDLKTIATLSGINKRVSFHTARHTYATGAITKGVRMEHVSKLLGHGNITETQIYAKMISEELDKSVELLNV